MSSLITYLLQVCLMLLVFGAIAAALVRFGRRPAEQRSGPLELVARLRLEGRRGIYLVRAGRRVLVVGSSEAGLTRLGELDRADRAAFFPDPQPKALSPLLSTNVDATPQP